MKGFLQIKGFLTIPSDTMSMDILDTMVWSSVWYPFFALSIVVTFTAWPALQSIYVSLKKLLLVKILTMRDAPLCICGNTDSVSLWLSLLSTFQHRSQAFIISQLIFSHIAFDGIMECMHIIYFFWILWWKRAAGQTSEMVRNRRSILKGIILENSMLRFGGLLKGQLCTSRISCN